LTGDVRPFSLAENRRNGGWREQATKQLAERAGLVPIMTVPPQASEFYGAICPSLEAKGEIIGNNDLWIAAHAKAARLTLVTNNERQFRRAFTD
jgi:tRNA(fMet)-specific endonuclease VapC